jgi:hypothetical protein
MTAAEQLDPIPYLRSARERLVSLRPLEAALSGQDPGGAEPAPQEAFAKNFGPGLRSVVERYLSEHPDTQLRFIRYTRAVDDRVELILDSGDAAPAEDAIVQLTNAVSAADVKQLSIIAEVLIAALGAR